MKRIKLIAGILCAISLIAFSGCDITDDDDNNNGDGRTRVFNITTSDTTSTSFTNTPNYNVIFPPVLNNAFTVSKGKVNANEFNEITARNESISTNLTQDYENSSWATISKLYVDSSSDVYLSPDDTNGYAYRIKSHSYSEDVTSDLIYPEDIIKIECKWFEYIDGMFLWEIEFSEEPDTLYLVSGSTENKINYKSAWKFTSYLASTQCDYSLKEELEPSETNYYNYRYTNPSTYTAIFAKYGDYYVRVTPIWSRIK